MTVTKKPNYTNNNYDNIEATTLDLDSKYSLEAEIIQLYWNRGIPFSILTALGIIFNVVSFIAIVRIRGPKTVYNVFLANLAMADAVGAVLLWTFHNSLLIFPSFEEEYDQEGDGVVSLKICLFKRSSMNFENRWVLRSALNFASDGEVVREFIAICYPLLAQTRLIPEKAWAVVLMTWLVAFVVATTPALTIGILAGVNGCTLYKDRTNLPVEISVCLLAGLVLVVVVLYARIYAEVVRCRKRTLMLSSSPTRRCELEKVMTSSPSFHQQQHYQHQPANRITLPNNVSDRMFSRKQFTLLPHRQQKSSSLSTAATGQFQPTRHRPQRHHNTSSEHNYKAFLTTLILAGALLLFWLPYLIISSINTNYATEFLFKLKFFVFDILPMLTYLSDPIIYGVRIRSVRLSYRRVFGPIMSKICCCWKFIRHCRRKTGRRNYVVTKNGLSEMNASGKARNGNETSIKMTSIQDLSVCQ
ncbi:hypothetical protein HELRODRAFT_175225 [Helobdella robusta]|uniref:G-protein coupled receptors family 1 profile domain-containing protein n=1 Tax=Helobdella robusta TaxID=6412 RepID=T1F915_HELRO|nr:hypothetical protein HELRODRAFT_175225 [Helobdella robusta]ESO00749.1 hypothetical protein HELRODRAFT_175225 [Helobdella robusta]